MEIQERRSRRCAVTGTNGYLGSRLSRALKDAGWTVYRLSREGREGQELAAQFSLAEGVPQDFFKREQIKALVHCAYDFRLTEWTDILEQNVLGSIRLMEEARAQGVEKIIFISTMSAFDGCKSLYGKAKLLIEKEALALGATVIRPGLIYGDEPGAMVGALTRAIKSLPVVPLIGSGRQTLYLAHEDDLAALVLKLLGDEQSNLDGPIIAASERGKTFRGILTALAAMNQRRVRLVPLPWRLFWGLLKASEACGLKLGFRSDSVVSLVHQDPHPSFEATRKTGVHFRDFGAPLNS